MDFAAVMSQVNDFVWGPVMLFFLVGTGVFLTIRLKFRPWLNLPYAVKMIMKKKDNTEGDVTPFQSLMIALSAHKVKLFFVNLFDDDSFFTTFGKNPSDRAVSFSPCDKERVDSSVAFKRFENRISSYYQIVAVFGGAVFHFNSPVPFNG